MCVWKEENKLKRGRGWPIFNKYVYFSTQFYTGLSPLVLNDNDTTDTNALKFAIMKIWVSIAQSFYIKILGY